MKANGAPEKIYLHIRPNKEIGSTWHGNKISDTDVEYVRKDAFIEKAAEFLYNYNQKQTLKHGARATLGLGEYTINVDEFRNYMKGE